MRLWVGRLASLYLRLSEEDWSLARTCVGGGQGWGFWGWTKGVWVPTHHAPPSPGYWAETQYSKLPSADKKKWAGPLYGKKIVRERWHIDCLACVSCGPRVHTLPLVYKCRSVEKGNRGGRVEEKLKWHVRSGTGRPMQKTHRSWLTCDAYES